MQDARSARPFPWPPGSATGIGSMPGTAPDEAVAVVLGELPGLPHLPELPARGPGADMIGRTAAILIELPVETTASGWRLAERPGRDLARAAGMLSADLDAAEAATSGFGGTFKIQVCGPWTLAAALQLTRSMEPALTDQGAVQDLIASLAEGVAAHVAAVRRRLPDATILLQVDEPGLPAVLVGSVPTASGLNRLAATDELVAVDGLRAVLAACGAFAVVHCRAPNPPLRCVAAAGAGGISFDLAVLRREEEDAVGEAAESGLGLLIGAVAPGSAEPGSEHDEARAAASSVISLWRRIGLPPGTLTNQVVVTPARGLAAVSPARARAVLTGCQAAARLIPELIEEGAA